MTYTVNFMDKTSIEITESEFAALMESQNPLVHFPRLNRGVNKLTISTYGKTDAVDRGQQKVGVLHDGTTVVRQFGQWYDAAGGRDEHGRLTVTLDPQFYPEVAADCVPTPSEYAREYANLPPDERKAKMLRGAGEATQRRLAGHKSDLGRIEP